MEYIWPSSLLNEKIGIFLIFLKVRSAMHSSGITQKSILTMVGKIKKLIDTLIERRSQGNPSIASTTRTKLLLKGIDSNKYTEKSDDDPEVIASVMQIADEMGINLKV
jgi:hypothetical protein